MKVFVASNEVFACYMRSCAPPPIGKGGSSKGGYAAAKSYRAKKAEIQGHRKAASTYGTDKGKEGPRAKARSASPDTMSAVKKAQDAWRKSGKAGDQRDEKVTARMLTEKYGTRGTGKGKDVKKSNYEESRRKAKELTARYARGG